ncbi:rhomboid family intramembrane serine protease [Blastochloris sulfoviridis]|uniref:Rhomboid family intramembrane serine protease n=1 Tax=Blastochloris sulfoviridis TaxID=50712 RepID=A0A5M6I617_9HYPH|nr:rhomboid family intramembrane serine protease [Blastochloris sulfoviridis]KAA5603664.1 rhomboid family intramembrane serine protease [Blastochloris sulfoviridis]
MDAFNRPRAEPMFNVPQVVLALTGAMVVVHLVRELVGRDASVDILLYFAFIPARYGGDAMGFVEWPGGVAADVWTFVTYAFLHADWAHVTINSVWLLAFGSPVAWRFGAARFLGFFVMTAAAGAAAHLALHIGEPQPLVGASAALSGCMAAAARFVFEAGGPLGAFRAHGAAAYRVPALPLAQALRDPRIVAFLAVWVLLNFLFGLGSLGSDFAGSSIAWEAHLGGFVAGLVGFALFDPIGGRT